MSALRRRLALGASLCAFAAAAPLAAGHLSAHALLAQLPDGGAGAAVSVSWSGAATLSSLRVGEHVTIGALRLPAPLAGLIGGAAAQSGGYSLDAIAVNFGPLKIDIPKVTVDGASISKDDFMKLYAGDAGAEARLRAFSARAVSAPLLKMSFVAKDAIDMTYEFKDITADGIERGRVGRLLNLSTTYTAKDKLMTQTGAIGKTEVRGLDLAQGARVYFGVAGPDEKLAPLYDSYVVDSMTTSMVGAVGVDMEMGRFTSNAFRARPMKGKSLSVAVGEMIETANAAAKTGDKPKDKSAEMDSAKKMFAMVADLFDAFADDGMAAENMKIRVGEKAKPFATVAIARMEGSYGGGAVPSGFKMTDLDIKAPDVTARLGQFGIQGFSYAPILKALKERMAGDGNFDNIDPRQFVPTIGTWTLRNLDVDAPDPKAPKGVKPERIKVKLAAFDLSAKEQINGVPTDITLNIGNLALKLPESSSDASIKQLKALGYSALDMSAKIAAKWNETTRDVAISEFSVAGVNMGSVRLTANLGNIGREVFEAEPAMAQVALMGATAKGLSLKVDNAGLAEKLLAFQARAQNRKPEDLRKELGTMAALGIPAILGPSDDAKAIANAIAKFLAKPGVLTIDVAAKNAGGVGIPDLATLGDPQAALGLVRVKAQAD